MSEARKGSWFGSVHMFVDFIKELFVDSLVILACCPNTIV